jgi:hypothetical protein
VLRFTSCQAEIAETFCKALALFIGEKLAVPSEFINDVPWQEREQLLDRGDIQFVGFAAFLREKEQRRK